MGTAYNGVGYGTNPPQRVNQGWFSEAWRMYGANAGLWISAVLLWIFAPIVFDVFIFVFYTVTNHFVGLQAAMHNFPSSVMVGLIILNLTYLIFMAGALANMALKQVCGAALLFGDIFSGGANFGRVLAYTIAYCVPWTIGTVALYLPGIIISALLLPGLVMIADGVPVAGAISKSINSMKNDRAAAFGFVFLLNLMVGLSALPVVAVAKLMSPVSFLFPLLLLIASIGLLVTVALCFLISALAYRDMVGIPRLQAFHYSNSDTGILDDPEPVDDPDTLALSGPRLSLAGESLDENGNIISPPSR